jgi:hypothetical protein
MTYYTITGKTDGFGAQYQAILSGIAYCHHNNLIYVHTPFTKMEHSIDIRKANEFIGINNNRLLANGQMPSHCCKIYGNACANDVYICSNPSIYYTPDVLRMIRDDYLHAPKPSIGEIDIAIHIRRGDVKNGMRYTDNHFYKKVVHQLRKVYPTYTITILSEGKYDDFKDLGIDKEHVKLNTDVFETFHSLVCAKVLIQACSSFSYCAGILNENTVYHMNTFWRSKLDHWLNINDLLDF